MFNSSSIVALAGNVLQLMTGGNRQLECSRLTLGAVMCQFIFYFFTLAFNNLHNLTKIILKLFAKSK